MDPYLEMRWRTFHGAMIFAMLSGLNHNLQPELEARVEDSVRVADLSGEEIRGYVPDVMVVDVGTGGATATGVAGGMAVAEPIRLAHVRGPISNRTVQIVDAHDDSHVITSIELLSPWNKLGGRLNRDDRAKIQDYEQASTNWVELDLLRSSRANLPVRWRAVPRGRRSTYLAVIYRAFADERYAVPMSIRQRLPAIGVPLREGEPDVPLDLQTALDRAYDDGAFRSLDYTRPPDPPLSAADAVWAAEHVRPLAR